QSIGDAEQPRHDGRMPIGVDAPAAFQQLADGIEFKMAGQIDDQHRRKAGKDDRRRQGSRPQDAQYLLAHAYPFPASSMDPARLSNARRTGASNTPSKHRASSAGV